MAATDVTDRKAAKAAKRHANTVDAIPPVARLFPLGLQHVLAMYAGAVAVPLIVGGALGYSAPASRRSSSPSGSGASACGCRSCRE